MQIEQGGWFEVVAPVELRIVCFRPRSQELSQERLDWVTDESVTRLQESGAAVISSTAIAGRRVMRVCITNHRTEEADLDLVLSELRRITEAVLKEAANRLSD